MDGLRRRTRGATALLTFVALFGAAGCGADDEAAGPAARGEVIARERGCAGCHGADGQGLVGPPWVGLAGSEVTLEGGETVVVDRDYLIRSIVEPDAERRENWNGVMPAYDLPTAELDDLVAYLESLSE